MEETRRIVLLGKTGVGKSSLANTIFGEDVFKVNHTLNSDAKECQAETRCVNERSITLIDTPGLFDRDRPEEIVRCITECAPQPRAFLIVLRVEQFSEQEKDVIRKISEYFSEEAFKYSAVVFTHGDQLPKGMKVEEFVQQNKGLRDLVKKCGDRCHIVDNQYWKNNQQDEYRSNQFHVAELLNTIDKIHKTRRIVLLGKTGVGKSSLANTIFGEDVFTVNHTLNSDAKECQAETRCVNERSITLIDTPGLFDRDRPEEIVRCITECAPQPRAFLIVLRVEQFSEQEKDVIRKISEYFSEEAFKYSAVVFTHGDQLPEGMKVEEFVQKDKGLSDLVKKCGDRCHIVDNQYWKNNQQDEYRSNQFHVAELLNTIDKIHRKKTYIISTQ